MPIKNVVQVECECNRCGHRWTTRLRDGQLPLQCANIHCHSEYWNKKRIRNVANHAKQNEVEHRPPTGTG